MVRVVACAVSFARAFDVRRSWLLAERPSNMLRYLRHGSALTSLRAGTLRQKLQVQLSTSPGHSILTRGQPVPELALSRQAPGRVATRVPILESHV